MYSSYTADGYTFDDKDSYNAYLVDSDSSNCAGWVSPNPENYGGCREESNDPYKKDTSDYHSSHYQHTSKDPKYYHGPREEFDIEHETEKAYLLYDEVTKFWCPKALIIDVIRVKNCLAGRIWKGLNRYMITNGETK